MTGWCYAYAGLKVVSDLPLPEWDRFASLADWAQPDVAIRLDAEAAFAGEPLIDAATYRFTVPDVADYWVRAGQEICINLYSAVREREVRLFLLGSAWGALCYQRGLLALHASVIDTGNGAVAFCGASGAGKSSLAAWLAAKGYPLIGDDLCRFDHGDNGPCVYPGPPRLKLWRNALDELGWCADGLERDHFRMEKFHLLPGAQNALLHSSAAKNPTPLRALYLLAWGEVHIERLQGMDALFHLIESATYRGELLEPMGQVAAHWQRCAAFARNLPIYRFTRPQAWSAMPAAMGQLVAQWR